MRIKIVLVSCDNLKGISESLLAVFQKPKFKNVLFIKLEIHQHVFPKDLPEFIKDMKEIYKSSSYENALITF